MFKSHNLNIAIAGIGIAGSFLYMLLNQKGYKSVSCYDIKRLESCNCKSCAWGVARQPFVNLVKSAGLDPEEYILQSFDTIFIDDALTCKADLCTINKPGLLKDLVGDKKIKILDNGARIDTEKYDLVVDATGYARAYLPPIKNELLVPTVQYRIKSEEKLLLKMSPGGIGYGWIFPLGNNEYHIGLGSLKEDLDKRFNTIYGDLIKKSDVICKCKSSVRVLTPKYAMPIVGGKIVGVGEAAGTVIPMVGAGIVSSFECALLLGEYIDNIPKYEEKVVSKFGYLDVEVELIRKMLNGGMPSLRDAMALIQNSKKAGIFLSTKNLLEIMRRECEE